LGNSIKKYVYRMNIRENIINNFLEEQGWPTAQITLLAGDASNRKYFRVKNNTGRAILMDAPPNKEDVRPFIFFTNYLLELGYSVPNIFAENIKEGLLLLEDFGDNTFTQVLLQGIKEAEIYECAIDLLIDLHKRPVIENRRDKIEFYSFQKLYNEISLFVEWYMPLCFGIKTVIKNTEEFYSIWVNLFENVSQINETLVLRDFHADNLVWLPEREGIKRCGLLDYQDAVIGSRTYDLLSLLEDARRDIMPEHKNHLMKRYLQAFPELDKEKFDATYHILAAQRHCKVLGIFSRLHARDNKDNYLAHLPRCWEMLKHSCLNPSLLELRNWLHSNMPTS